MGLEKSGLGPYREESSIEADPVVDKMAARYEAQRIMGEHNFYGPEEVKNAFGFEVQESEIPPIPYSPEELEKARELGEVLILRVGQDAEGNPMTIRRMSDILDRLPSHHLSLKGLTGEDNSYQNVPVETAWKLIGREIDRIDESGDRKKQSYFQRISMLRNYLIAHNISPIEMTDCSDERLQSLCKTMGREWNGGYIEDFRKYVSHSGEVNRAIASLGIVQQHIRSVAEIVYDRILLFRRRRGDKFFGVAGMRASRFEMSRDFSIYR